MPVGEKVQTIAVFSWHTTFKGMQCKNVRLEIERRFVRLWAWPFLPFPPSFGREMCEKIKPPAGKIFRMHLFVCFALIMRNLHILLAMLLFWPMNRTLLPSFVRLSASFVVNTKIKSIIYAFISFDNA